MNYDKLSRALRYYYNKRILYKTKVSLEISRVGGLNTYWPFPVMELRGWPTHNNLDNWFLNGIL